MGFNSDFGGFGANGSGGSGIPTALNSAQIIVGNSSNVAAAVNMSGDITISNAGVTTIGPNKVIYTNTYNGNQMSIVSSMRFLTGN